MTALHQPIPSPWAGVAALWLALGVAGVSLAQGINPQGGGAMPRAISQAAPQAAGFMEKAAETPADWMVPDFNFSLLESAAEGGAPAAALKPGVAAHTYRIDELSRTTLTPSGSQPVALPAAGLISATQAAGAQGGTGLQTLGQAFGNSAHGAGAAGQLGVPVTEQDLAGVAGGLAGLAAYGPLAAAVPENIWLRSTYSGQVRQLKNALETPLMSPALRQEWRTLLLAAALPPQGAQGQPHWLAVRAELLEKLGFYEAAWSLWREAGPLLQAPELPAELRQGWARASLLAGQNGRACTMVREQAAAGMVSEFWPSAAAVCAALELVNNGGSGAEGAALTLAIQLLPPGVLKADPALVAALNAVRDNARPRVGNWPVGSLAGSTLAAVPALLEPEAVGNLPDVTLRRLEASTGVALPVRTAAALQLSAKTGMMADATRWLVLASSPTLPAMPLKSWPDIALIAWAKAFVQAHANDPSATLSAPVAALVMPAALRAGDINTALAWWEPYRSQSGLEPTASRARWQAYLALQLAQQQNVSASLASWYALRGPEPIATQRVLAVVAGMGQPVDPSYWAAVAGVEAHQADTLNLAWQNLVREAAQQQDRATVLAMVSEALRGQNAATAAPAVLQAALAALRQVGLPATATRLAAEALTLPITPATRVLKMAEPSPANADKSTVPVVAASTSQIISPTLLAPHAPVVPRVHAPKPPLLPKPRV